jgi:hypothetical protein
MIPRVFEPIMIETSDDQRAIIGKVTATAPGSSLEQQETEDLMIGLLGKALGVQLVKHRFRLPAGGWLEIGGYCSDCSATFGSPNQRAYVHDQRW